MNFRALRLMLSMIPRVLRGLTPREVGTIRALTREMFPGVAHVATDAVAGRSGALLIDVRSAGEFAVSHLPGAVNAHSLAQIDALARSANLAHREVVLYCAVGFRSALVASRLQKRGLRNISNLEGSIFQWANEGRPLVRDGQPVREVHAYGPRWAGLLAPGITPSFGRGQAQ